MHDMDYKEMKLSLKGKWKKLSHLVFEPVMPKGSMKKKASFF